MKFFTIIAVFLLPCAAGCAKGYISFSGTVRRAAVREDRRRPVSGARVILKLPNRVFSMITGPDGKFEIRYMSDHMNAKEFFGWVAFAERKGFYSDVLRVGRYRGLGGLVREHDFLLIENDKSSESSVADSGEPDVKEAFEKSFRYLAEDPVERKVFAINAIGLLVARTAADNSEAVERLRLRAALKTAGILTGGGDVKLRRLAARKMVVFLSFVKKDVLKGAFRAALNDSDKEVVYWVVLALRDLYGIDEASGMEYDMESPEEERGRVLDYWKKRLE